MIIKTSTAGPLAPTVKHPRISLYDNILSFKHNLSSFGAQKSSSVRRSLCLNGSVGNVCWVGCHNDIYDRKKTPIVYRSLTAEDCVLDILFCNSVIKHVCGFLLVFNMTSQKKTPDQLFQLNENFKVNQDDVIQMQLADQKVGEQGQQKTSLPRIFQEYERESKTGENTF